MIDHLSFYATNFPSSKRFYESALAPLGYQVVMEMVSSWDKEFPTRRLCAFGPPKKPIFPRHIAFAAMDCSAVDAFHKAGLSAGGTDNGAPGPRPIYHPGYYGAFVVDPDGNNVEAVCHRSQE